MKSSLGGSKSLLLCIIFSLLNSAPILALPADSLAIDGIAALADQSRHEECDDKYGRPSYQTCALIIEAIGGRRLGLDNYRPYRFFHHMKDIVVGQVNFALPYTRTYRDCALFIDTPEHIASNEPAENQWEYMSWNEVKAKAQIILENCINLGGPGGSIVAGRQNRLQIHLIGPNSRYLEDYAQVHPELMRYLPGSASREPNAGGMVMPSTETINAATVCHSDADCASGSSCPAGEGQGQGAQGENQEMVYGRAFQMAVAICAAMMKGNGLRP